jgi:hypothetical protein
MRRVLIAIAIVTVTALPSFAGAQPPAPAKTMQQHPQMRQELMRNPEHLLMVGYRKNLMTFGHILENVARQGDTVPADLARTAVAEMRHSVDQIEKFRPVAQRAMPAEMQQPGMQKMMDQHLVDVKTHLRQLDDLSRSDRIPSQDVLKHLQPIFEGCQKMGCGAMHNKGRCQEMQGGQGKGGCGCEDRPHMKGGSMDCGHSMGMQKPGGHPAMQEMVQKMKQQDAEMASQVKRMQHAPKDKKVDVMAGIVAQLVQQRADFTSHIEKMQHHMMQRHPGMHRNCADCAAVPPPPPGTPTYGSGEGPDEEDVDTDDVDTGDVVGY